MHQEKPGQVLACRYWLSMCLDYGEVPCNGFYDLWGEFPEAKGHEGRVPSLNQLMTLVSENDYGDPREVLLVDYTSDTRLCQLRTVALAACAQCDSVESKVRLCKWECYTLWERALLNSSICCVGWA